MKHLPAILLLTILVTACNKSDDKGSSKTELIASSSWKYDNGGIDQNKDGKIDVSFEAAGLAQSCALDNTLTFKSDGSGVNDEGATKCDPALPQTTSFTWKFQNNESQLLISGNALVGSGNFRLTALTSSQMSLAKDTTIAFLGTNVAITLIANLKH